jgi:hypothetical protein
MSATPHPTFSLSPDDQAFIERIRNRVRRCSVQSARSRRLHGVARRALWRRWRQARSIARCVRSFTDFDCRVVCGQAYILCDDPVQARAVLVEPGLVSLIESAADCTLNIVGGW